MSEGIVFSLSPEAVEKIAERAAELVLERNGGEARSEWLTSDEAAEYLRCVRGRIHNLVSEGRLPHHKEGGRLLFARSELDEWIKSGRAAA